MLITHVLKQNFVEKPQLETSYPKIQLYYPVP